MLKKEIKPIIQKLLLGFAAGVMIAASVWSLLIPAIEMAETQGKPAWLPASVGFMIGIVTLIGVNNLAEKIEKRNNKKKPQSWMVPVCGLNGCFLLFYFAKVIHYIILRNRSFRSSTLASFGFPGAHASACADSARN